MARTDLTATPLAANGAVAQPGGVAGAADGHRVHGVMPEELILHVTIANAATTVEVKAGAKPPALETRPISEKLPVGTHLLGPFTSAHVVQADGSVHVDYETPANVTVAALAVPRRTV